MQSKFKKLFAVLILLGAVLAFCSPAMARFSEVGDRINFAGYNWTLYQKDAKSGYIITTDVLPENSIFDTRTDSYPDSALRKFVKGYEEKMKAYTGEDLTWDYVNGTADGKNYIEKHYGVPSDDLLYVLSDMEAIRVDRSICRCFGAPLSFWWLRSRCGFGHANIAVVYCTGGGVDIDYGQFVSNTGCVRPCLQISLDSPIFTKTDGQSDSGDVNPVKPINPHGEEEQGKQEEQKAVWKVGGEWNYTITLPEFTDTFDGVPVKISAEQTGNITITAADSEKEAGKERIAGGAVESVRSSLKYELPDGTVETFSSYFEGPMDLGEKFKKDPYNPGEEVSFTAPLYYDTHEGEQQIVGFVSARYSQTEENKFEGTVTLSKTPGGTPIASGTFEAAKRSKDSSSGCNAGFGAFALLGVLGLFYRKKK